MSTLRMQLRVPIEKAFSLADFKYIHDVSQKLQMGQGFNGKGMIDKLTGKTVIEYAQEKNSW